MIPFPILSNLEPPKPRYYNKVVYSRASVGLLLTDTGNSLYSTGDSARLGITIARSSFINTLSDVDDVWSNLDWSICRTKSGVWYWSGSTNIFGISTGIPWSNVSSRMTGFGTIKKMVIGSTNIFILNTANEVWACGSNSYGSFGRGSTTGTTTFIKLAITDVKDIFTDPFVVDNFYYLKNDGTLFGAGYGGRGNLGAAYSSTGANTSFIQLQTGVEDVQVCAYGYLIKKGGQWIGSGYSKTGLFGTGSTDASTPTYTDNNVLTLPGGVGVSRVFLGDSCTHVIGTDNKLYFAGGSSTNSPMSGSTTNSSFWTSNVLEFTEVPGWDVTWSGSLREINHFGSTCTYFILNRAVYACGRTSGNANYSLIPPYKSESSQFGFMPVTVPLLS